MHQHGPSRVDALDLQKELALNYPATAPNLLASFVRVLTGETLDTGIAHGATSQSFYVIRGNGSSVTRAGQIDWNEGDLFVLPYLGDDAATACSTGKQCIKHACEHGTHGGCALYWVHDELLLRYLGVEPADIRRFEPALYPGSKMKEAVGNISTVTEDGVVRNRRGILLGNPATPQTKTLTPTMWSLLNSIDGGATQHPHKHNSVALDLAVDDGDDGKVYSLLGRDLDREGNIVNARKVEWQSGGVFVTPPGWWHSHHNTGGKTAWVLPIQDAGLYTHQRTLDIRFMGDESARLQKGINRGATVDALQQQDQQPSADPLLAGTLLFGHSN